jgi:hypothetical protein
LSKKVWFARREPFGLIVLAAERRSLMAVTICSCSDETLCLIGDGGDSTSHGVCRHIDDRGINGASISRGVGGLVDNRVYGDSVSGSGSLVDNQKLPPMYHKRRGISTPFFC